jgi:hypothetical protein
MGDSDLDSDTDSKGTGERRAAGRDQRQPGDRDRDVDTVRKTPDSAEDLQGSTGPAGTPGGAAQSGFTTERGAGTTGSGRGAADGAT